MLINKIRSGGRLIAGLDFGSSKISMVVGEISRDGVSIISVGSYASSGIKKGVINDIDATAIAVRKAASNAEKLFGTSIKGVFAGISGTHIKSFINHGSSGIKGGVVTERVVEEALEAATDVDIHEDAEMIQILPIDFIVDGQGGISNPVGMRGSLLEVKAIAFISDKTALENLIKCCEMAEVKVEDIILLPLATAEASLTPQERENGSAIIDIGAGTTEIVIYKYNLLKHFVIIGIGGNHFTNDISIVLEIPFQEAERIKLNNGYIFLEACYEQDDIETVANDGNKKRVFQKDLFPILLARSEELLELVRKEIDLVASSYGSISQVMLTGGACLLPGFGQLAEKVLSTPAMIAYPEMVSKDYNKNICIAAQTSILKNVGSEFNQPIYATGIGLVMYGTERVLSSEKNAMTNHYRPAGIASKWRERFKNIR